MVSTTLWPLQWPLEWLALGLRTLWHRPPAPRTLSSLGVAEVERSPLFGSCETPEAGIWDHKLQGHGGRMFYRAGVIMQPGKTRSSVNLHLIPSALHRSLVRNWLLLQWAEPNHLPKCREKLALMLQGREISCIKLC